VSLSGGLFQQVNDERAHPAPIRRIVDGARRRDGKLAAKRLVREQSSVHGAERHGIGAKPIPFEEKVGVGEQLRVGRLDARFLPRRAVVHPKRLVLADRAAFQQLQQRAPLRAQGLPAVAKAPSQKAGGRTLRVLCAAHHRIHDLPRVAAPGALALQLDLVGQQASGALEPGLEDVRAWDQWGAGVGIKCGSVIGLDIDVLDPELASDLRSLAISILGETASRTGRPPKVLLPYRFAEYSSVTQAEDGDVPRSHDATSTAPNGRLPLSQNGNGASSPAPSSQPRKRSIGWTGKEGKAEKVEILGNGQQFVALGIHPGTLEPYTWDRELTTSDDLPAVTEEQLERFLDKVETLLEQRGIQATRSGRRGLAGAHVAITREELLAPSIADLREVVAHMPNGENTDRDEWIWIGIAIKAAAGREHEADGLELFLDYSERWEGGLNESEYVRETWGSFRAPFSIGWDYLLDRAREHGFNTAVYDFEPLLVAAAPDGGAPGAAPTRLVRSFAEVKPTAIEWLLPGRVARQQITTVNGWPGEGKTSVVIDIAARMTRAEPLPDGSVPPRPLNVLFLSTEDSESILTLRLRAADADVGRVFTISDTEIDRLTLPSNKEMWLQQLKQHEIDVVVVDPMKAFLDTGLKDISEQDARRFMQALRQVCEATNAAAICIRHPNKATAGGHTPAISSASGSLAFTASARIELLVGRLPHDDNHRALVHVKNNLARPPVALLYRIESAEVPLSADASLTDGSPTQEVAVIEWLGTDPQLQADDLLARRQSCEERRKREEAEDFLKDFLKDGPVPHWRAKQAAKRLGIAIRTLERARNKVSWSETVGNRRTGETVWGLNGQTVDDYKPGLQAVSDTGISLTPADRAALEHIERGQLASTAEVAR
jgi:hypothetical protein